MKTAMGAAFALLASVSFAAVSQNFESGDDITGLESGAWSGDGTIETPTVALSEPTGGYAISGGHAKVLDVSGTVTCANTDTANNAAQTDFLIYLSEASESLDSSELGSVQVALAAGTSDMAETSGNIPVCIYCIPKSGSTAAWVKLAEYAAGSWVRVSLAFDYSGSDAYCRVSLNGLPAVTSSGVLSTSDTTLEGDGSWYKLVAKPESANRYVKSLTFVGAAQIDDVVVGAASAVTESFTGSASVTYSNEATETVSLANLNKWGVTPTQIQSGVTLNTASGMTVLEKLETGLDPTSGTKFAPTELAMTSATAGTIKFPCEDSTKISRYSLGCSGATATLGAVTVENGVATATFTISDATANVVEIWLKAVAE